MKDREQINLRCSEKFKEGVQQFAESMGMNSTDFIKRSIQGHVEYVEGERESQKIIEHYGFRVITRPRKAVDFEDLILEGQD
jgi:hypothetical protein